MRDIRKEIRDNLDAIENQEERDLNPQMSGIIPFIRGECTRQKQISDAVPDDHKHDYNELNNAFRELLRKLQKGAVI